MVDRKIIDGGKCAEKMQELSEKNSEKPLTTGGFCGIITPMKKLGGVQTARALKSNTPLQTSEVEIKMLVHSQRAVVAESTAERRAYQMDH